MANGSGGGGYRSRKAKKQRTPPKRGPGVAQLERILHEEEQERNGIVGISSSSSSLVASLPVTGNGNGSSQLGCSKGVYIGGSGVFLPEQTLLPISWGSSTEESPKLDTGLSFPSGSAPSPSLLHKNDHNPMMDLFPLSPTTTTTPPPSSAGVYEPPSSQNPSHHSNISALFPEEDKPRPSFLMENRRPAPPRVPFQPNRRQASRLDPLSSSNINGGVFSFGISRDPMPLPTSPLDQGNPTTTQNCQPDLSKFNKNSPIHENTERPLLKRSSSSAPDIVPVYKKGFFSFLLQPENTSAEPSLSLKTETCAEKTGEFIDLDLKL